MDCVDKVVASFSRLKIIDEKWGRPSPNSKDGIFSVTDSRTKHCKAIIIFIIIVLKT